MTRLKEQGVTDFGLVAYRGKMTKKEITYVNQGGKRPASSEYDLEEEAIIKRFRASVVQEVKIELSKESSESNRQWEQKFSRLEEDYNKKISKIEEEHKKIPRLEENLKIISLQVSNNDKQISKMLQIQEARDEKFNKDLREISISTAKSLQKISMEMNKNLQDTQNAFAQILLKQTARFNEAFESIAPKKQEQVKISHSNGSTYPPSSARKSNQKASSSNQTDKTLRQIFGNSFTQDK